MYRYVVLNTTCIEVVKQKALFHDFIEFNTMQGVVSNSGVEEVTCDLFVTLFKLPHRCWQHALFSSVEIYSVFSQELALRTPC